MYIIFVLKRRSGHITCSRGYIECFLPRHAPDTKHYTPLCQILHTQGQLVLVVVLHAECQTRTVLNNLFVISLT